MPSLTRTDDVYLLDIGDTENRFHPDWLAEIRGLLNEVAAAEGPRALVTTGTGKFFSNGLDLEWLGAHRDQFARYVGAVQDLLAGFLTLPVPSVAAVQGHAFAAGAMLTLAHDSRVMRADRGFWCLPEVDIKIPFTAGMSALIQARLPKQTAHEAMTTGRRYGGEDALGAGIVEAVAAADDLRNVALERARALTGTAGDTLGTIKERMYAAVVAALRHGGAG